MEQKKYNIISDQPMEYGSPDDLAMRTAPAGFQTKKP